MALTNDAELQDLFRQEMSERVQRLLEGARSMAAGEMTEELAGAMFREGHTIKGTSRVMGFEAISRAGQNLESVWRRIQHGDLPSTPELGMALEALAASVLPAITADPDQGTSELIEALMRVDGATKGEQTVVESQVPIADTAADSVAQVAMETSPDVSERPGAAAAKPERSNTDNSDLGGLLNALETWASEDVARVNAANLYRLINTVAAVGVETRGLRQLLLDLADSIDHEDSGRHQVTRLASAIESLERSLETAKLQSLTLASAQLKEITNTYPQLVRYLAKKTNKEIRFELVGDDMSLDRQVLERLADPLRQLLVNAIEHGVETPTEREETGKTPTATIALHAEVKDHRMEIVIEDDGRGVDWGAVHRTAVRRGLLPAGEEPEDESLRSLLFAPGFSTAATPSELVGDGSGLTAVASSIEALHGSLRFETEPGKGTRVTIAVPTSRALQDALIIEAAGQGWGVPETAIVDTFPITAVQILQTPSRTEMVWMDQRIPVASFAAAVGVGEQGEASHVIVIASPVGSVALTVNRILGQQQVAAKELGPLIGGAPHLTGAALLGGGDVVVLVDPSRLAERAREVPTAAGPRPRVLVVDDSPGARQVVAAALASSGFETHVAGGAEDALLFLARSQVDALVVDYSMPGPDGISLVQEVRANIGQIPIVMLSGVATPEDQARAKDAGVDAYFDKADFREGALASTLESLVAVRGRKVEAS